ncbi:MAG: hypothetical protein LUI10_10200 [Lachnospiraceae bacterium]|nr:hypothetical protein [Lachnospiraceae bacterium]
MRYKFVYPVYTVFLLFANDWFFSNVLSVVLIYAPYRFVVLIPVPFIIALMVSGACNSVKGKGTVLMVLAALLFFYFVSDLGDENYYEDDYKIENVYGLPQDVVDVCDLVLSEKDEPLLLVNDPDVDYFRQYSAKVKLINVNIASMPGVAATRSEYTQIKNLMADSGGIDMEAVGELAAACEVDYIILNVDAYNSVFYEGETWYSLYEVVGDYLVFKVNS